MINRANGFYSLETKQQTLRLALVIVCSFFNGYFFGQSIICSDWTQLVPSLQIPDTIAFQNANNNLDLVRFRGKYYLGIRTAPTHFASPKTKLYILSSDDAVTWNYEHQFHLGYDMREPRFVVYHDTLFFYFFEGGNDFLSFEPRHLWACSYDGQKWSSKKNIGMEGFVPWRIRERNDTLYLSAYYGLNLYASGHKSDLRLFTSTNGWDWKPISKYSQVTGALAGEEGEFIFDRSGHLWGTVRLEGFGAYLVFAHKDSLHVWKKKFTKFKYDSALLFEHEDEIYLISRRNLDGRHAKLPLWLPKNLQKKYNLVRYSLTRKVTALFRLNKEKLKMEHIMDFPSTGDTAFPGIAKMDDNSYLIMNYSNDINGRKKNWITGQLGRTNIYYAKLKFR